MDLCASRGLLVSKILLHFETDFLVFSVDDRGFFLTVVDCQSNTQVEKSTSFFPPHQNDNENIAFQEFLLLNDFSEVHFFLRIQLRFRDSNSVVFFVCALACLSLRIHISQNVQI